MRKENIYLAASIILSALSSFHLSTNYDMQIRGFPVNYLFIYTKGIEGITQNPIYTLITQSSFDILAFAINCYIYYLVISKIHNLHIDKLHSNT